MSEPLMLCRGTLSPSQYMRSTAAALVSLPLTICAQAVGILCLIAALADILTAGFGMTNIFTAILSIMFIVFTPLLPRMQARQLYDILRKSYAIPEGGGIEVKAMLFDDKIVFINSNDASEVKLSEIRKIKKAKDAIVLITRSRLIVLLPINGFLGGSAEDALKIIKK